MSKKLPPITSLGNYLLSNMKASPDFPFLTGELKFAGTVGIKGSSNNYDIIIGQGKSGEYVAFLQEGTEPHDIPNAFGLGYVRPNPYTGKLPFGVGGRFNDKFHPGSRKHKGFIDKLYIDMCANTVVFFERRGFTVSEE